MSFRRRQRLRCLFDAQDGLCAICGARMLGGRAFDGRWPGDRDRPTLDHVFALRQGGFDGPGNLLAAHARCNEAKAARWPTEAELRQLAVVNGALGWPARETPAAYRRWVAGAGGVSA